MYLKITRCEITQSSCKRDTKSKSHVGMKFAPVRVFLCKHPLIVSGHRTVAGDSYGIWREGDDGKVTEERKRLLPCSSPGLPLTAQLTTAFANQTTGLTNGRAANWAPEVTCSLFRALSLTFPFCCQINLIK